jgi:hypothetical protein
MKDADMRTLPYACILAAACLLGGCHSMPFDPRPDQGSGQPRPAPTQGEAAQAGLQTLGRLVNDSNYARLGFNSREEARQATLGAPLAIYHVRLDALRSMPVDGNPDPLISAAQRSLYPVQVGQRVACAVFVGQAADGWRATDMGNPAVARAVAGYRKADSDFIVHVPALQSWFIGRRGEGGLTLTPVFEDNRVEWKPGVALPAERVFQQLRKLAQDYNGLPQ